MAAARWLGIDLGTSSVKAALIDASGRVLATEDAPLKVSRPKPGWSEQDPAAWIAAAEIALDALAKRESFAGLRGIGLSGQMHGATLLDESDRPLRPCILWNDGRSGAECRALEARADFRGIAGNIVMPGFTAPKLEWVRSHEEEIFEKVSKVLLPKDFLRYWLTGGHVSEMSDAAGTAWLDVARRRWSPELLAATGLSEAAMPALVEGSAPSGRLRRELAERWGVAEAPVVAGGAGDNAAAACGVGAVAEGAGFLSIGTSGVLFVATDGFRPNTEGAVHAFCHAIPETWHQMGVMLSAADSLSWLARITGRSAGELAAMARPEGRGGESVTFLPYLSGERTPHNDPELRGVFRGLSQATEVVDLAQAVLEGVAYGFADCADALRVAGTEPGRLWAVGGGARSDAWLQIAADALGVELARGADEQAGAALGAARLGFCASEGAAPREVCAPPQATRVFAPDPAQAARHQEGRARFREALAAA